MGCPRAPSLELDVLSFDAVDDPLADAGHVVDGGNAGTGARFYDKSNIDQKDIAILLYD